jgi:hypothetical protein
MKHSPKEERKEGKVRIISKKKKECEERTGEGD